MIQNEFNFTGEQLRDAGIRLATEHADGVEDKWSDRAYQFLLDDFLPNNNEFMTEDLRQYAAFKKFPQPPSLRAWGGIILKAAKRGVIVKLGIRPVKNPKAHCTPASVWESALKVNRIINTHI